MGCVAGVAGGRGLLLRLVLGGLALARLRARPLHVDAAPEMRPFGNRDARRRDVAVDRPVVSDIHFLGCGDVAGNLAEDDHGLGEYLRLDFAVRADGQHVLSKLDLPFDLAFDGEILAAVQLALDDHGFADIHGLLQSAAVGVDACVGLGPRRLGGCVGCGRR